MLTSEPVLEWKKRAKGDENMQKRIRTLLKNKDFAVFFEIVSGYNDSLLEAWEKWEKEAKEAWERDPRTRTPRAARLNGFYTYICLRKLRV